MKKVVAGLLTIALILAGTYAWLIGSGTISSTSLSMILNVATGRAGITMEGSKARETLRLPTGFSLDIYATNLPRARFLSFSRRGDLLVSRPHSGDIVLLDRDRDGDHRADGQRTLIDGLNRPQGMDFHDGWLYVAERDRVGRIRFDHESGKTVGTYQPIIEGLTGNGNHWSKSLRFGPDGLLYLAQGSTCNVCVESDERRATMMRFQPDGSGGEIIATGLRNSVGFDWAPWNGGLYATDNGRDMLGDDFPPCELNLIEPGNFYGWPYYNGNNFPDPDMGPDPLASSRSPTPPVHGFRAHNAPLGIRFVETSTWPGDYERVALVALHGSWNRSVPDGYRVVSLHFRGDIIEERPFLDGFYRGGKVHGRPVDIAQGPDGAVYISDDYASAIYRISLESTGGVMDRVNPVPSPAHSQADISTPAWVAEANLGEMHAAGKALYQLHNCASCHEAGENPVSLAGLGDRLGYNGLIAVLQAPRPPMPLFPLDSYQQRALAVYLLTDPDTVTGAD